MVTLSAEIEDYCGDQILEDYIFSFSTEKEIYEAPFLVSDSVSTFTRLGRYDLDWGNYDNDKNLDLIIFGTIDSVDFELIRRIELFENQNGIYDRIATNFKSINPHFAQARGCIKWADYNNDNFLNMIYAGQDL